MRKVYVLTLCLLGLFSITSAAEININIKETDYQIRINNTNYSPEMPVYNINGVTYVSLRDIYEKTGHIVSWKGENQSIEIIKNYKEEILYPYKLNEKYGYMDKYGNAVTPAVYDGAEPFFENGKYLKYTAVYLEKNGTRKYGLINNRGEIVFPIDFIYAFMLTDDIVAACGEEFITEEPASDNGIFRLYNIRTGELLFDKGFYSVDLYDRDIISVCINHPLNISQKWGYIDLRGEYVNDLTYDVANPFNEKRAAVKKDGKWGVIDNEFKQVVQYLYDEVGYVFSEGRLAVKKNGKWGYIDTAGNVVVDFQYDYAGKYSQGIALVYADGSYGCIDYAGSYKIALRSGDMPWPEWCFSDNYLIVSENNKIGVINISGEYVIEPKYETIIYCGNGMFAIYMEGKRIGYLNEKNEIISLVK